MTLVSSTAPENYSLKTAGDQGGGGPRRGTVMVGFLWSCHDVQAASLQTIHLPSHALGFRTRAPLESCPHLLSLYSLPVVMGSRHSGC